MREGEAALRASHGQRHGARLILGRQGGQGSSHSLRRKVRRRAHFLARVILGVVGVVRSYGLRTAGWQTSWPACTTLKNPRTTRRSAVRQG